MLCSTKMAKLTITIDEATLKKARIKALREGLSVNQLLREFLESCTGARSDQLAALQDILELAKSTKSGHRGKRRTRDELHDMADR
jgi:hypothetical protein